MPQAEMEAEVAPEAVAVQAPWALSAVVVSWVAMAVRAARELALQTVVAAEAAVAAVLF